MKKKVLVITQNFPPEIGSAANRMMRICQCLNEQTEVTILTTEPQYPHKALYRQKTFQDDEIKTLKIKRIKTKSTAFEKNFLLRFFLYLEVLYRFLKSLRAEKTNYDIIFVSSPPLSIPLVGLVAKRKFKAQLITDIRDLWPETLSALKGISPKLLRYCTYAVEKYIYRQADKLIVNSEGFIAPIQNIVGKNKKIYFLPNALTDFEFSLCLKQVKQKKFTIVYVGNVGIAQDLDALFELAAGFKANHTVQFLLIGYGVYYQKVKQKLRDEGHTNIILKMPEPRQKIFEHLKKADVAYVGLKDFPIFKTVIPGKIMDYMGAGLPIIGVCSGYSKHIIEKAGAGFVFTKKNGLAMKRQIEKWMQDEKDRKRCGENGRRYAIKHFSWQKNQTMLQKIVIEHDQ